MSLQVGSLINNYNIKQILGENKLGTTYLGSKVLIDQILNKQITKYFTISTIQIQKIVENGMNPESIKKQIETLINLSKKPLCNKFTNCYYEYFTDVTDQIIIVVTDYIEGESLQQMIINAINKGGFETSDLLKLMFELAEAVEYIHSNNISHQNIKPSNIIYDKNLSRLRLIDFDYSCSFEINTLCKGKASTIYYTPPELLKYEGDPSDIDFAFRKLHDIWSLGVVFFQMANPGKDYMNFNSNEPLAIAENIKYIPVKQSEYKYKPVNAVINLILIKDYSKRPTASQIVVLTRQARPLCVINDIEYDRDMSEVLVTTLGLNVDIESDDETICKALTGYLNTCNIKNNKYNKKQLLELSEMLGFDFTRNIDSAVLCDKIQKSIDIEKKKYSKHLTQKILDSLEYISVIEEKISKDPNSELIPVLDLLQIRFQKMYDEAMKLELVDSKLLELASEVSAQKSAIYEKTNPDQSNIHSRLYHKIKELA